MGLLQIKILKKSSIKTTTWLVKDRSSILKTLIVN